MIQRGNVGAVRKVGRPPPGLSEVDLDGETSLFDPRTGQAFALNRTASDIWALADGTSTIEDLVDVLARAYAVAPEQIRDDVVATVDALEQAGVLEPAAD